MNSYGYSGSLYMKNTGKIKWARNNRAVSDMALIALFVAIITVSSWISIPFPVPFTLQTMAVMLCACLLGPVKGVIAVVIYIILGVLGVPVFSSFGGGISHLFGITGGYILGFIPAVLITGIISKANKQPKQRVTFVAMLVGNVVCYICGSCYFAVLYTSSLFVEGLYAGIITCVVPYIIPDIIKLVIASEIDKRMRIFMKRV